MAQEVNQRQGAVQQQQHQQQQQQHHLIFEQRQQVLQQIQLQQQVGTEKDLSNPSSDSIRSKKLILLNLIWIGIIGEKLTGLGMTLLKCIYYKIHLHKGTVFSVSSDTSDTFSHNNS